METLAKQLSEAMVDYYVALHCEQGARAAGNVEMHYFERDTRNAYNDMLDLQNALAMAAEAKAKE